MRIKKNLKLVNSKHIQEMGYTIQVKEEAVIQKGCTLAGQISTFIAVLRLSYNIKKPRTQ